MRKRQNGSNTNYEGLSTEKLYNLAANGDLKAESTLLEKVESKLQKSLYRVIWETTLREDVIQDTLLACLVKIRQNAVKQPKLFLAYAHSIGRNIASQTIKRLTNDREHVAADGTEHIEVVPGKKHDQPDASLQQSQTSDLIKELMEGLNQPRDREILINYYFDEHDSEAICQNHDLQKDHLYRVLHRARQRLAKLLEQQHPDGKDLIMD